MPSHGRRQSQRPRAAVAHLERSAKDIPDYTMNAILAAIAADDLKSVVLELKEVLHRLDVLERDAHWHEIIATSVFVFFGLSTIGALWRLWSSVEKKVHDEVEKRAKEADGLLTTAKNEIAELKRAIGTKVLIESGLIEFTFGTAPHVYASHTVLFKSKFPQMPQVFVTEANAGDWVYMKVDKVEIDRFVWAARTLTGQPSNPDRVVRLNWVAVHTEVLSLDEPKAIAVPAQQ